MAKQGQKLTDELKEQIRAHLVLSDNKNDIAKRFGVSWATVDKIEKEAKSNDDGFEKLRDDKKQMMIDKLWDQMVEALELGHQIINDAKQGMREVPLGQVSTYYGTLYDKRALMMNENTQNVGVSGGLTVVFDPDMG